MSATALPFQEGMNTVGAPRVMPLLEQRLTRVRRHRVALWMVDTGVVALTALLTVALPVEPRLPRAALVATVLTITVAWATAMLILRYATREGGLGGRFDLLAILHPAAIAVAVVQVSMVGRIGQPVTCSSCTRCGIWQARATPPPGRSHPAP